jgi:hypothetical protein
VIQQHALHGQRGFFYALAVVQPDDHFHEDLGVSPEIASATKRNLATTRR